MLNRVLRSGDLNMMRKSVLILLTMVTLGPFLSASEPKSAATKDQVENAKSATEVIRGLVKSLIFYPGSSKTSEILTQAIETLPIHPRDGVWKGFLHDVAFSRADPALESRSQGWIQAYTSFMFGIAKKLIPQVNQYKKECSRLYGQQEIRCTSAPFDHWTTSKMREDGY